MAGFIDNFPVRDDYEIGDPIRVCINCGSPLEWDYPYDLCEICQETESCLHGTPYSEVCNSCCIQSDFAFDSARERGWK